MIIVQLNGSITDPKNVGSTHPCGEHVVWTFWSCFLRTISERNEVYPVDSYLKRTDPPPFHPNSGWEPDLFRRSWILSQKRSFHHKSAFGIKSSTSTVGNCSQSHLSVQDSQACCANPFNLFRFVG